MAALNKIVAFVIFQQFKHLPGASCAAVGLKMDALIY
jgi:hypothetical protein